MDNEIPAESIVLTFTHHEPDSMAIEYSVEYNTRTQEFDNYTARRGGISVPVGSDPKLLNWLDCKFSDLAEDFLHEETLEADSVSFGAWIHEL